MTSLRQLIIAVGLAVALASCSSTAPANGAPTSLVTSTPAAAGGATTSTAGASKSSTTSTTASPTQTKADASSLGKVVCDSAPTRMDKAAERFTAESWRCDHKGEGVRIDLYKDADQMATAKKVVLEFYNSSGDKRTLADLPMLCGSSWSMGVDLVKTRDQLIAAMTGAGFPASTC